MRTAQLPKKKKTEIATVQLQECWFTSLLDKELSASKSHGWLKEEQCDCNLTKYINIFVTPSWLKSVQFVRFAFNVRIAFLAITAHSLACLSKNFASRLRFFAFIHIPVLATLLFVTWLFCLEHELLITQESFKYLGITGILDRYSFGSFSRPRGDSTWISSSNIRFDVFSVFYCFTIPARYSR